MPINVPESVFEKYYDVIDSTFNIFGVTCQLVSVSKVEEIVFTSGNNIPAFNSINAHRLANNHFDRGNKTFKEVETLTDIKLKVYWDSKNWIGISKGIVVPDGTIQTIGFMSDLPQVLNAKQLIIHKGIKDYKEMRFERSGEHIPLGLRQVRYFACFWRRV